MRSIGVLNDGSYALRSPDTVTTIALSTVAQAVAVQTGATHVFFSATQNFAVSYNATAGTTTASFTTNATSGCEINPTVRYLGKNTIGEISIIGAAAGFASMSWYNSGST